MDEGERMEASASLADAGTWHPFDGDLVGGDPLGWAGYPDAVEAARDATGVTESVLAGNAAIGGTRVELAEFDFRFLGGSMGEATGERLARAIERAARRRVPFVLRTATGGARMQEGMMALVQMPKLAAARATLAAATQPFVVVLANPTTGGVLAGLAALADVTIAEEGATVGFAGPRVAERATGQPLTGASHTAMTALRSGLVDVVAAPGDVAAAVAKVLRILTDEALPGVLPASEPIEPVYVTPSTVDAWEAVEAARSEERPTAPRLVAEAADTLFELRGDRAGDDDPACRAALAHIAGRRALVLALDRRHAPGAGAYRKARRALEVAGRLHLPVLTLVDTKGADPSSVSENAGVAWAIGQLFEQMLNFEGPTISIITGEGGSGGALAFATADVLLAQEGAVFSVIGPELAAEILWKDSARASEAAALLKLTAADLTNLGIIDAALPDPPTGPVVRRAFAYHLRRLETTVEDGGRAEARRKRWRGHG
ncbi:MAG TPA: carboxyl transferase domain-containing protein [Actinomycetota bacterium]|nr:carboxyl transferase domain-containing protein [Actinomycetota bacterium]